MFKSFFQKKFNWIFETFKDDNSKMLIATGTLGWALSSLAQIVGIYGNKKITAEKRSFLVPQEVMDAVFNVTSFLGITLLTKKGIEKMASTGKIATLSVRNFLDKNPDLKKNIGKIDFNLDKAIPQNVNAYKSYKSYKNFVTTMGTLGASVLSCNIITPVTRNITASRVHKNYIDTQKNPISYQHQNNNQMKI